jgi:hypothetical protein
MGTLLMTMPMTNNNNIANHRIVTWIVVGVLKAYQAKGRRMRRRRRRRRRNVIT